MRRLLHVVLGEEPRPVGLLHYEQTGAREHAAFTYDPTWLAASDRYSLELSW